MEMKNKTVAEFMTQMPHSIEPHQTIDLAKKRMHELGCHHLPVLSGRKVIGVLSERDILFLESFKDVDTSQTSVVEVMIEEPMMVRESDLIIAVAKKMVGEKIGSILVIDSAEKLVGIFTSTDALKIVSQL